MSAVLAAAIAGSAALAAQGMQQGFAYRNFRRQARWQERMSNTAYQRAAKDLDKAGLNRILAIRQGGASAPGAPGLPTPSLKDVVKSGIDAAGEYRSQEDQDKLLALQAINITQKNELLKMQHFAEEQRGLKAFWEANSEMTRKKLLDTYLPQAVHSANFYKSELGYPTVVGKEVGGAASSLIGGANRAKGLIGLGGARTTK